MSLPGPGYASVADGFSVAAGYNSLATDDSGLGNGWTLNAGPNAPVKLLDHSLSTKPEEQFDSAEVLSGSSHRADAARWLHLPSSRSFRKAAGE